MLAVSCKNIKKAYGRGSSRVEALRGIDLELHMGELLMIVGPSGCGKTTLISVIAGILQQDAGECLVFGQKINSMPDAEKTAFRGKNIGFVFQAFNLVPMLSSCENIAVPLILNGVLAESAEAKAVELLTQLGMPEKAHISPAELSGGQQQRVAIARGFIHDPRLIVCDEPTAYLDGDTGKKVIVLIRERAEKAGKAVIVVTHDSRIFEFADRIVKMEDGQIIS